MAKQPVIYIITNKRNGTLYTGVTSNLIKRIWEHKNKVVESFASKYGCTRLVYYECTETMESAIMREKSIKKWDRLWKIALIEKMNPHWDDLYRSLI